MSLPAESLTSSTAVQPSEIVDDDDDFVYDVYRTDDQFDFQSLEHVLAIQAFGYHFSQRLTLISVSGGTMVRGPTLQRI